MGMTIDKCTNMLTAKENCIEHETSGIDIDCNAHNCDDCSLCYEQGTMGEQKEALIFAVETMRKYQQLQADYENRLKADLKAILVELQLEIEQEAFDMAELVYIPNTDNANVILMDDLNKIIQQRINSLKEA